MWRFTGKIEHTEAICKPFWELGVVVVSPHSLLAPNLLAARTSARLFPQLFSPYCPVGELSPTRSSPQSTGVRCGDTASRRRRPLQVWMHQLQAMASLEGRSHWPGMARGSEVSSGFLPGSAGIWAVEIHFYVAALAVSILGVVISVDLNHVDLASSPSSC
ncbi:hypothetical protein LZ30DRAFT_11189 [Colletotrichum cereale]|nr:hypothetical protein LZ30DRAFT_11189 [Colletotrichum cereale]